MKGTFLVQGSKVRIGSQRRYVLLTWMEYDRPRWIVWKRSDTRSKLERIRHTGDVILDTETGEVK